MMRLSAIVLTFVLVACGGGSESSQGSAVVPTLSQLSIQKHLRIVEYSIPTASSNAIAITAGPDGNLWFAEERGNNIGRITRNGRITEYPIPTTGSEPENIIAGPDGNMWFTEYAGSSGKIGRITTNGVITEYPISSPFITPPARAIVGGIASGPGDGYIWVALLGGGGFGRITPTTGVFSVVTYEANCTNIVAGPDRNLWGLNGYGNIERITTSGTITDFPMPTRGEALEGITAGPDGNMWFTEYGNANGLGNIGRITTNGVITEYPVPNTASNTPWTIAAGPDGNLWFTDYGGGVGAIGRITTNGAITQYATPTALSGPLAIAAGPDGNMWFTELIANKIAKAILK